MNTGMEYFNLEQLKWLTDYYTVVRDMNTGMECFNLEQLKWLTVYYTVVSFCLFVCLFVCCCCFLFFSFLNFNFALIYPYWLTGRETPSYLISTVKQAFTFLFHFVFFFFFFFFFGFFWGVFSCMSGMVDSALNAVYLEDDESRGD